MNKARGQKIFGIAFAKNEYPKAFEAQGLFCKGGNTFITTRSNQNYA